MKHVKNKCVVRVGSSNMSKTSVWLQIVVVGSSNMSKTSVWLVVVGSSKHVKNKCVARRGWVRESRVVRKKNENFFLGPIKNHTTPSQNA